MSEITILDTMPVVLTKDTNWNVEDTIVPGTIIRLPEDAVLVTVPEIKKERE